MKSKLRIDGALTSWWDQLQNSLLQILPLPAGAEISPLENVPPPPRATITQITSEQAEFLKITDALQYLNTHDNCYTGTVVANRRITADDWSQDVRHLEFTFIDEIQCVFNAACLFLLLSLCCRYSPGYVAVIRPIVNHDDVQSFLVSMGWDSEADSPMFALNRSQLGNTDLTCQDRILTVLFRPIIPHPCAPCG